MFTNLQLRAVQATDARTEYDFADYFSLRLFITVLGWIFIALLVFILRLARETQVIVLLVATSKAIECCSDIVAGLLQKHERLDRVAISLMIRGVASLAAFGTVFAITRDLTWAAASIVLTWLAVLVLYDSRWASRFAGAPSTFFDSDWSTLGRLFRVSLPLGITMTLISLNVNVPRYLLQHYLGLSDLGIFASLAYLVVAVSLIVTALGQSVSTRLSQLFANREFDRFRLLIAKLAAFGLLVVTVGVPSSLLMGRFVLTMLYSPAYGDYSVLLAILVAAAGVNTVGSFLGYGITAARKFREQVPLICCSTLTTVIVALMLVPRLGLMGAALALLASACVLVVAALIVLRSALAESHEPAL
jgi:O-antigen/teichoic acid export membrane protein